mgnify:CR=1 FL=1
MKIGKYFIGIIGLASILSCNDFLDEKPTSSMTTDSELSSEESALSLTNSAYINSTVFDKGTEGWGCNTILLLEYMTGKSTSENSQSNHKEFQDLLVNSRSLYIEDWWNGCYAGIANCNLALLKLPEFVNLDHELIKKYEGEVRFMRALYYFYLVRIFGDVPKITTVQTSLGELQIERSPVKEIYDEIIIPDLLEAEKSGLAFADHTGRVSMAAVKSLLADVYLTYAGYPIQGGEEYYAESAKRSLEVLDSNEYTFFNDYSSLRDPGMNNEGEYIFQVQFALDKRHNDAVRLFLPSRSGMSAYDLEYGSLIPTAEFVASFEEGDKRAEEKQYFFSSYKGHPSKFSPGAPELEFMDFSGNYVFKFFDQEAIDNTAKSFLNWSIYRLTDVMLMYAEAQLMSEGMPNQRSIDIVNQIRERANLEPFSDRSFNAFREEVWDQRYFDLCYENKMWFDMLRTRKIRDDKSGKYVDFVGYTNNWGKVYTETQLLFPIPLGEMQANSSLVQNPGY